MQPKYLNIKYCITKSPIHGKGVISKMYFNAGEPIDIGIDFYFNLVPYVTPNFGTMLNHSWTPNAYLELLDNKHYVVASRDIYPNEEITIDYRKTPWYILGPSSHFQ